MRIRVDPDQLRQVAQQMRNASNDLGNVSTRVGNALSGMDFESRQKVGIESQVNQARNQANALASRASELARYLDDRARAFAEADGQGVKGLKQVSSVMIDLQQRWQLGLGGVYNFPTMEADTIFELGLIGGGSATIVRTVIPQISHLAQIADRSKTILLAGRSKVGQWLPFVFDMRRNPWRAIKSTTPAGFLIDAGLGFIAHPEDWTIHGAEVAVTDAAINLVIGSTGIGAAILVTNAVIQLGGSSLIWGISELGKAVNPQDSALIDETAKATQDALSKIDVGRVTRDVATTIVDLENAQVQATLKAQYDMWQNPDVWNVVRSGLLLSPVPVIPEITTMLIDPEAGRKVRDDAQKVAEEVVDFGVGLVETPFRFGYHIGTVSGLTVRNAWHEVEQACSDTLNSIAVPAH
jgi:hypothetical protein